MIDLKLTIDDLKKAINHLSEARRLVEKCQEKISGGSFMVKRVNDDLSEAWYQVNCCRLYTEPSVTLEGFTQAAMGEICDAVFMLESLSHSKKGLTLHAKLSLLSACSDALGNIQFVSTELEGMLSYTVNAMDSSEPVFGLTHP